MIFLVAFQWFFSIFPTPTNLPSFSIKEIATLTHKFSSVTLYKNKTIRYAARLHAIIACQMEFQLYPMDIQICPIYIESFSYSNSKVRLKWAENGVNINPELKLLQYNLGAPLQLEETDGYMPEKDGNYSRLTVYFRFERQIGGKIENKLMSFMKGVFGACFYFVRSLMKTWRDGENF